MTDALRDIFALGWRLMWLVFVCRLAYLSADWVWSACGAISRGIIDGWNRAMGRL